jgi:hypothetical protein
MSFLTDAQITQSVSDILKYASVGGLPTYAANVVTEAHAAAYNEMLGRLLNRGYTLAQITSWDQGVFYERMLSIYFVMVNVAGTGDYSDLWIKQYDRRKDLDTVLISIGGVFVQPVEGQPGTCSVGTESTAADVTAWMNPNNDCGGGGRWGPFPGGGW